MGIKTVALIRKEIDKSKKEGIARFLALDILPTLPPNRGFTSLHSPFWGDEKVLEAQLMRVGGVGRKTLV